MRTRAVFSVPASALRNVRGVLLDLDNTLYNYVRCHSYALRSAYAAWEKYHPCSFSAFEGEYDAARRVVKHRLKGTAAAHSRLLYFQTMCEAVSGRTDPAHALALEKAYWRAFVKRMRLYPGVRTFLAQCVARGQKVCVVTDLTAEIQLKKLVALKIDKFIDLVVSSEEAGFDKPHKRIFGLALMKLGLKPHEVVLIGDDHEKDILGARALGIRAIHMRA